MTTLSSLVALEVVITTTSSAASDDKVVYISEYDTYASPTQHLIWMVQYVVYDHYVSCLAIGQSIK